MVGSIYKDFKVSKWFFIVVVLFFVYFLGMILYDAGTMEFKNVVMNFFLGLFILNFTLPLLGMFISVDADEKEKWMMYAMALPGGSKGYVKGKYALVAVMVVFGGLVTFASSVVFDMIAEDNIMLSAGFLIFMISSGISMLACSLQYPIIFYFGSQKGSALVGWLLIAVLCAVYIWYMFGDLSVLDKLSQNFMQVFLWVQQHVAAVRLIVFLFFMVGVAAMRISYKVSVCAMRKAVEVRE